MKHQTLLLFSLPSLASFTLTSELDFVKLNNYKIMQLNKKKLELSTNDYFHNRNDVGFEVLKTEVKLLVNWLHVSNINQSKVIELDANNEFYIPMNVCIPLEKISKDKFEILGGLFTTLADKNLTISTEVMWGCEK